MVSNLVDFVSHIGASTMLGICTIPAMALCVRPKCVLFCGARYCMLCYTLYTHHNYNTPPHQTGCTPVDTTTTKYTNLFPNP